MTQVQTTPVTGADLSAEYTRMHNLPGALAIASAINEGINAHKQGEHACLKLTYAFYQAMTQKIDERGTTLVSVSDAKRFCKPWEDNVVVTDTMRDKAKDEDKKFIDDLCIEWSSKYKAAIAKVEELKGKRSSEVAKNEFDEAFKLARAVKNMVRRAIVAAYFILSQGAEKVNLDEKKGLINIVTNDDRHSVTITVLEDMADEEFPSKAKPKGTPKPETDGKVTTVEGAAPALTLLDSLTFVRTHVTRVNFNAQSKDVRELCKALFLELLPVFQAEVAAQPVLIKKDKKSA